MTCSLKPLSPESGLLYVGMLAAIASLVAIDHYNMATNNIAQSRDAYLAEHPNLPSSQLLRSGKAFSGLPAALSQNSHFSVTKTSATKIAAAKIPTKTSTTKTSATKIAAAQIAAPAGWKAVQVSESVTAYVAPQTVETSAPSNPESADRLILPTSVDGTRWLYVTEIDLAEVLANSIAPQHYVWHGVWRGEGYSRELGSNGSLVSRQEGGNDIHLTLSYNTAITNPGEPNLIITIESQQDKTAQLTNLSAFLLDSQTCKTLARRDFAQLPPFYYVSLTYDGTVSPIVKSLPPLGTVTFAYHVSSAELPQHFPMELQAVNQFVDERAQEIANLEVRGWLVKEVPSPGK